MVLSSGRIQLTLWNVVVVTLILLGGGVSLHYRMRAVLSESVDLALEQRARPFLVVKRPPFAVPRAYVDRTPHQHPPFGHGPDLRILTKRGREPFGLRGPFDSATFPRSLSGHVVLSTVRHGDDEWRVYSAPNRSPNREIIGVVQTEQPLDTVGDEIASLDRVLLTLLPVALLAAGLGGAGLAVRSLRPVRRIAATAERIQAEDLSERLPVSGRDEYAQLAATLNAMLGRLQSAFDEQRRFTSDASHELRTPLTAIKAKTSVALTRPRSAGSYRETLAAVDRTADQMALLVQNLLQLAQADAGQIGQDRCRVAVRDVVEMGLDLIDTREGPPVLLDIPDPDLEIFGNPSELSRVICNLVSNARRHTPPTGRVSVRTSGGEDGVEIAVSDTGEGIAPQHLPHLGQRFYRVDAARGRDHGGTGLGLAICKSIVEAHGGLMEIESRVGCGTVVRIHLPA